MEYLQERITTLHGLSGSVPDAPIERAAVIVPMTGREYASLAAERVLRELTRAGPARVYVPIRTGVDRVAPFLDWLEGFDLPVTALWCNGPTIDDVLSEHGLRPPRGKGRDVWLALGLAAERDAHDYVLIHDADSRSYDSDHLRKLCWPLANDYRISKGYYARVEDGQLYGRLFRLFVVPMLRALSIDHTDSILEYLSAFRYALAGEIGLTGELARSIRAEPTWGFEIGTLGDAFEVAGFEGTAQVDLGIHEHDHRSVSGPSGLSAMCPDVSDALLRVLIDNGVDPAIRPLRERYREAANELIRQYETDAKFNGLRYDPPAERRQVDEYLDSIRRPTADPRLPAWRDAPIDPGRILDASKRDVDDVRLA